MKRKYHPSKKVKVRHKSGAQAFQNNFFFISVNAFLPAR